MDAHIDRKQNSDSLRLSPVLQEVDSIDLERLPSMLAQMAALLGALSAQLLTPQGHARREIQSPEDRLLTVAEAAQRLSTTPDWLYRHASKLPFTVRLTPKQLRFSSQGIDKYLQRRQGLR
jgi:predicted DNA-binding transcriptional regulator AlpA